MGLVCERSKSVFDELLEEIVETEELVIELRRRYDEAPNPDEKQKIQQLVWKHLRGI